MHALGLFPGRFLSRQFHIDKALSNPGIINYAQHMMDDIEMQLPREVLYTEHRAVNSGLKTPPYQCRCKSPCFRLAVVDRIITSRST